MREGLKGLVLDNFRQDPAMLKETVTMQLFARMGVAAPRASHVRVHVNNEYLGLYAALELVDKSFLRRTLGEDDGYLYDFEWDWEYRLTWLGHDPRAYSSMFKAETHESQPPDVIFGTLIDMITAVNRTGRDAWPQVLTRYFDVEHLMAYAGVEAFLDRHHTHAGHRVAGEQRPLDRCRAPPAREQREVQIDHRQLGEHVRLDQPAEGDDDAELGTDREHVVDRVRNRDAEL